ncbi:MAG: protein kinase [Candidatus Thermoplasmatota archaeon]|nr:protein kinase [Candidatus Thermoplasmatota archaeon]MCL5789407.1 protein kinase [Candidatus Thermoplasmatota archaeon]
MPEGYDDLTSFQNGRYSIIKKLGEGGKGIVFKCQDNSLGRIVALKLIKGESMDSDTFSRLMREAQTTAKLSHPGIMAIYDLLKEGERFIMVIEFVDGKTLDSYISELGGSLTLGEAVRITRKICDALSYAHGKGILHRDIKPENIMISKEKNPKLMDFGLAKSFDSPGLTHAGTIIGTPAYLAPECALGKEADARSDLYSLGCVLYQMLTGVPPFKGEDSLKLIYSHIHDIPPPPSKVNPHLPVQVDSVVMKLLSKNPDERYSDASELADVLSSLTSILTPDDKVHSQFPKETTNSKTITIQTYKGALIGLDDQIRDLRNLADSSLMGNGKAALITGDAGLGKTRLSSELRDYSVLRGMRTITVKCRDSKRSTPHYVLNEIMREYLYMASQALIYKVCGDYSDVAIKLLPDLEVKLGKVAYPPNQDPDYLKLRFQEGVIAILGNISAEGPICVIVEDAQFADSTSVLIMKALSETIESSRALLVVTVGGVSSPTGDSVQEELLSTRKFYHIILHPLDKDDTRRLISSYLSEPMKNISDEFLSFIYKRTAGNPLYIEEVLKFLIDKKVIYKSETGSWERKQIENSGIPASLVGIIRESLAGVDDFSSNILSNAAVIGMEFDSEILSELLEDNSDRFYDSLEKLIKKSLLGERKTTSGNIRLFFQNPQIYYYFFDQFSMLKKRRLHQKLANIMEKKGDIFNQSSYGDLAYHFIEGGEQIKAVPYLVKLGDLWFQSYEYSEALQRYIEAFDILENVSVKDKDESYAKEIGEVCSKICNSARNSPLDKFEHYWRTGYNAAELIGDLKLQATMLKFGVFYLPLTEIMMKAESYLKDNEDNKDLGADLAALGIMVTARYWYVNRIDDARKYYKWTDNYIKSRNLDWEFQAINDYFMGTILLDIEKQSDIDWIISVVKNSERLEEGLRSGRTNNLTDISSSALNYYDFYANFMVEIKMDLASAENAFRKGMESYGKKMGLGLNMVYVSELIQMVLINAGRWEEAMKLIDERISPFLNPNDRFYNHLVAMVSLSKSAISLYRGVNEEEVDQLRSRMEGLSYQFLSHANDLIPRMYLEAGMPEKSVTYMEETLEMLGRLPRTMDTFFARIVVPSAGVEIYSSIDNKKRAEEILSSLKDIASYFTEEWIWSFVKQAESVFEAKFGDLSKAIDEMTSVVSFFKSSGYVLRYATTSLELAKFYQKMGNWSESSKNVANALEVFTRLDCGSYVRKCLSLMELLKA